MEEIFYLIFGILVLGITAYDFFFTTLSGSGTGFLTRFVLIIAHQIQLVLKTLFGRRIFDLSGMMVNLTVLAVWVVTVWLGLFLVFSFQPDAVVNEAGEKASAIERLYVTGYILSTLGLGNFKPTSPFLELLTSFFSFFGFVFFTTSMTYLIAVSSSAMQKRTLAMMIRSLGTDPGQVVTSLLRLDPPYVYNLIIKLQQMIDQHNVNHRAYPVLHYYLTPRIDNSLSVNITVLDEALSIILSEKKFYYIELRHLRKSVDQFLDYAGEKDDVRPQAVNSNDVNWQKLELPKQIGKDVLPDKNLIDRRELLGGLLKSEGFSWRDVYPDQSYK